MTWKVSLLNKVVKQAENLDEKALLTLQVLIDIKDIWSSSGKTLAKLWKATW